MLITIADTETTEIINQIAPDTLEVGAILFDLNTQSTLANVSFLLDSDNITELTTRINGITKKSCQALSDLIVKKSYELFTEFCEASTYLIAHNAEFDREQFKNNSLIYNKTWLCSTKDLEFSRNYKKNKRVALLTLADMYGVRIGETHRALSDCTLLASIFSSMSKEEIEHCFSNVGRKKIKIEAVVPYDRREEAKAAGFCWVNEGGVKGWFMEIFEDEVIKHLYTFPVEVVL